AREQLRRELGAEPTLADLAKRVGADEARLERTILRITTIESTSPLAKAESMDPSLLPPVLVPSEPPSPDRMFEQTEVRDRVRVALGQLPARERKILNLYYFADVTMKQIGDEIGVNESRVSQLHARAIDRLRKLLEQNEQQHIAVPRPKLVSKAPRRPRIVRPRVRPDVEHRRVA